MFKGEKAEEKGWEYVNLRTRKKMTSDDVFLEAGSRLEKTPLWVSERHPLKRFIITKNTIRNVVREKIGTEVVFTDADEQLISADAKRILETKGYEIPDGF